MNAACATLFVHQHQYSQVHSPSFGCRSTPLSRASLPIDRDLRVHGGRTNRPIKPFEKPKGVPNKPHSVVTRSPAGPVLTLGSGTIPGRANDQVQADRTYLAIPPFHRLSAVATRRSSRKQVPTKAMANAMNGQAPNEHDHFLDVREA